jgi:hypothetical protein
MLKKRLKNFQEFFSIFFELILNVFEEFDLLYIRPHHHSRNVCFFNVSWLGKMIALIQHRKQSLQIEYRES